MLAIIGGSGVYNFDQLKEISREKIDTPFGMMSSDVIKAEIDGAPICFLARHGFDHSISPSDINYRANIFGLKALGVNTVVSVSAVGSLRNEFAPGDFFLPDQFIDWTKGLRSRTFFENGVVGHVSVANPVCSELIKRINSIAQKVNCTKTHMGGSYICIEGPQFSTKAESNIYRQRGASVIGMTNVPEAYLAKEAGISYATIAMVTDYDCWKDEHCTLEEIMKVMKQNYINVQSLLVKLIPSLINDPINITKENLQAVVTKEISLSQEHKKIIEVLLK